MATDFPAQSAPPAPEVETFDAGASGRGRILVVDDDSSVRGSLSKALESEGYNVVVAADGQEALRRIYEGYINAVLLDLTLPRMNGWDVFERMTAVSPFLPIIIITARPDQYRVAAAAGATALMEKPLDFPLLVETLDRILNEPVERRVRRIVMHRPIRLDDKGAPECG